MKVHGGTFVSILLALMLFAGAVAGAEASQCTATAAGFNGDVTVSLTVENGKLASVEVKGDGETEGVGSRALEIMPELMLAGNTVDVDIVTGATFTSNAILTAAKAALAESGAVLSATDINIEQHNPRTIENTFEFLMGWSDWKANSSLVMRMLKLSGGTIEMLQDHWDKTDVHGITEVNKEKWALKISGGVDRY